MKPGYKQLSEAVIRNVAKGNPPFHKQSTF